MGILQRNPFFAGVYEKISQTGVFKSQFDPWRQQLIAQAHGKTLEVGAGGGQNFAFYDPAVTADVQAVEPHDMMREYAQKRIAAAKVPITLLAGSAEALPFEDAVFDSVVTTLVFCSVSNPEKGLQEIMRVLKPGGSLLMFEHVLSGNPVWATAQHVLTPLQMLAAGNCHLNRNTPQAVRAAGFIISSEKWSGGSIHPQVAIIAAKPA